MIDNTLTRLQGLKYLDWALITDTERRAAMEAHHRLVTEVQVVALAHRRGAVGDALEPERDAAWIHLCRPLDQACRRSS